MAYDVKNISGVTLNLGHRNDKNATTIEFSFNSWKQQYGDGTLVALVRRYSEQNPYIVSLDTDMESGNAVWTVTDVDTAIAGKGAFQLYYSVGGELVTHSDIGKTIIAKSLDNVMSTPSGYDSWLEKLISCTDELESRYKDALEAVAIRAGNGVKVEKNAPGDFTVSLSDGVPSGSTSVSTKSSADWDAAADEVSQNGALYVYSDYYTDDDGVNHSGFKIGDGKTKIGELPFVSGFVEKNANSYDRMTNKPTIESVELAGNKTLEDLGMATASNTDILSLFN